MTSLKEATSSAGWSFVSLGMAYAKPNVNHSRSSKMFDVGICSLIMRVEGLNYSHPNLFLHEESDALTISLPFISLPVELSHILKDLLFDIIWKLQLPPKVKTLIWTGDHHTRANR
ncbi:hypothetical protein Fmac_000953 [Flemingia macrophylla]|uniref:Uncharacterized protein n=1 Tax=Flemingia macrophylla TaxID=520843 RepID=A0ABD1NHB1_9FABA